MCFRDRTYCQDINCDCEYPKFTEELSEQAEKWWNPEDKPEFRNQAPICFVVHIFVVHIKEDVK